MKMRYLRRAAMACLLPLTAIALTSCATYNAPAQSDPHATVAGSSERHGLTIWRSSQIVKIDNQTVGPALTTESPYRVTPGEHQYTIQTQFNEGGIFTGGPYAAMSDVKFTARKGQAYHFTGKVSGSKLKMWAEDSRRNRVSPVASDAYSVLMHY